MFNSINGFSNSAIPLVLFLNRTGFRTTQDYLSLPRVPFPLITRKGEILYLAPDHEKLFVVSNNYTSNRKVEHVELAQLIQDNNIFVDIRGYDSKSSVYQLSTRVSSRLSRIYDTVDGIKLSSIYIKFAHSDLMFNNSKSTGKETTSGINNPAAIVHSNYNFSSLDLVNCVDTGFAILFLNSSVEIQYDKETGKFVATPPISNHSPTISDPSNSSVPPQGKIDMPLPKKTSSILDSNKVAIIAATKLEVGGLALDLITEQIAKGIPEAFRPMLVGNPLFKIAVANAVNLLVLQTNIDDEKLLILNDAMMTKSYSSMLESFDLSALLSGVLTQIPSGKLKTLSENG